MNDFSRLNRDAMVGLINKKYVPAEMTKEPTFEAIATLLMGKFVHQPDGKRDQAHNVLAMTMIYSMWCGWVSQSRADKGDYPSEWIDSFRKLIVDAFEMGQRYARSTLALSYPMQFDCRLFSKYSLVHSKRCCISKPFSCFAYLGLNSF